MCPVELPVLDLALKALVQFPVHGPNIAQPVSVVVGSFQFVQLLPGNPVVG